VCQVSAFAWEVATVNWMRRLEEYLADPSTTLLRVRPPEVGGVEHTRVSEEEE